MGKNKSKKNNINKKKPNEKAGKRIERRTATVRAGYFDVQLSFVKDVHSIPTASLIAMGLKDIRLVQMAEIGCTEVPALWETLSGWRVVPLGSSDSPGSMSVHEAGCVLDVLETLPAWGDIIAPAIERLNSNSSDRPSVFDHVRAAVGCVRSVLAEDLSRAAHLRVVVLHITLRRRASCSTRPAEPIDTDFSVGSVAAIGPENQQDHPLSSALSDAASVVTEPEELCSQRIAQPHQPHQDRTDINLSLPFASTDTANAASVCLSRLPHDEERGRTALQHSTEEPAASNRSAGSQQVDVHLSDEVVSCSTPSDFPSARVASGQVSTESASASPSTAEVVSVEKRRLADANRIANKAISGSHEAKQSANVIKQSARTSSFDMEAISPQAEQETLRQATTLVNSGQHDAAIAVYSGVLKRCLTTSPPVAALIGRGTAYALKQSEREMLLAVGDFSAAIKACRVLLARDPDSSIAGDALANAYQRRAVALIALKHEQKALSDFDAGVNLAQDRKIPAAAQTNKSAEELYLLWANSLAEALQSRGALLNKLQRWRDSARDAQRALEVLGKAKVPMHLSDHVSRNMKLCWNLLGMSLTSMGLPRDAIDAYQEALKLDATFKEATANCAQAFKELGRTTQAEVMFTQALRLDYDKSYAAGYHLRGLSRFHAGQHQLSINDFTDALRIDPAYAEVRGLRAVAYLGLGQMRPALVDFAALAENKQVQSNQASKALVKRPLFHLLGRWYQWEICLWLHHALDRRTKGNRGILFDDELHPLFKECYCKRDDPAIFVNRLQAERQIGRGKRGGINRVLQLPLASQVEDVEPLPTEFVSGRLSVQHLFKLVRRIGPRLQYHCNGFSANLRQHAMCGFAAVHAAQILSSNLFGNSALNYPRLRGWREFFDILILWRQLSEPNDPVFWVDRLSYQQFVEGFGSHTPMLQGHCCVIRYGCYASRALAIVKDLLPTQLPEDLRTNSQLLSQCMAAPTAESLLKIVGRDFSVITPVVSTLNTTKSIEGTRLELHSSTLVAATTDLEVLNGLEFSIKTAGTPERWRLYDAELSALWDEMVEISHSWSILEEPLASPQLDALLDCILKFAFYWYNFMPLSRGSAAVGYMSILSLLLAFGLEVDTSIPDGLQPDWEALLLKDPADFVKAMKPWLARSLKCSAKTEDISSVTHIADVGDLLPTARLRIAAMTWLCSADSSDESL